MKGNKKITLKNTQNFIDDIGLDLDKYKFTKKDLNFGMNVELEHGYINKKTNVTNDDNLLTGKIALAHLLEFPDYYERLLQMEIQADKYWKNKSKTNY